MFAKTSSPAAGSSRAASAGASPFAALLVKRTGSAGSIGSAGSRSIESTGTRGAAAQVTARRAAGPIGPIRAGVESAIRTKRAAAIHPRVGRAKGAIDEIRFVGKHVVVEPTQSRIPIAHLAAHLIERVEPRDLRRLSARHKVALRVEPRAIVEKHPTVAALLPPEAIVKAEISHGEGRAVRVKPRAILVEEPAVTGRKPPTTVVELHLSIGAGSRIGIGWQTSIGGRRRRLTSECVGATWGGARRHDAGGRRIRAGKRPAVRVEPLAIAIKQPIAVG